MKLASMVTSVVFMGVVCSACAIDAGDPASEPLSKTAEALTVGYPPFPASYWHGGGGGDKQPSNYCAPGYVVVGFIGRAGTTMDSIGFHCAAFYPGTSTWEYSYNTTPVGGTGGNPYSVWCPPNTWVKQVDYFYESTISEIWMKCGTLTSTGDWVYVAGSPSEYQIVDDCNGRGGTNAMFGLDMYSHTYVDSVLTQCVTLTPP